MLCPKRALLIGMTHEFDHHKDNEFLVEWSRRYYPLSGSIEERGGGGGVCKFYDLAAYLELYMIICLQRRYTSSTCT